MFILVDLDRLARLHLTLVSIKVDIIQIIIFTYERILIFILYRSLDSYKYNRKKSVQNNYDRHNFRHRGYKQ